MQKPHRDRHAAWLWCPRSQLLCTLAVSYNMIFKTPGGTLESRHDRIGPCHMAGLLKIAISEVISLVCTLGPTTSTYKPPEMQSQSPYLRRVPSDLLSLSQSFLVLPPPGLLICLAPQSPHLPPPPVPHALNTWAGPTLYPSTFRFELNITKHRKTKS